MGERREAFDGGVELGPGTELFHRLGGIEQQVEGGVGPAARQLDGGGAQIAVERLAAAPELRGLACGGGQVRHRSGVVAGAQQVVRKPRRARAARPEMRRDTRVQHARDRLRQQTVRGLADQVVHEAACIEQTLAFERVPGIGELEHIAPAHCGGQLGGEVGAGHCRDAHQQQPIGRQCDEPLFEQLGDARRRRQLVGAQVAVFFERVANRFQQVQRVAADAPYQRRSDRRRIDRRQRE